MKVCSECKVNKRNKEFYAKNNVCKACYNKKQAVYREENRDIIRAKLRAKLSGKDYSIPDTKTPVTLTSVEVQPLDPREQKEIAMKRMLAGAKARARDKGLSFNLHYDDVAIPNLCPVLKIPLIPSSDGHSNNSPSLDRMIPYLGYTKGNVRVISMKANRIKTDANSIELALVLEYVKIIEQENI